MKLSYLIPFLVLVGAFPSNPLRTLEIDQGSYIHVKESEKLSLLRRGIRFIDVTSFPLIGKGSKPKDVAIYSYPEHTSQSELMDSIVNHIDKKSMYNDLAHFTSFYTRYYKSESGYQSALWLADRIYNVTYGLPSELVSVEKFEHDGWDQFSIIVSIRGRETPEDIVILGSHQDSMNLILPSLLSAPGADDDGSGTVTNLETLRLYVELLSQGYRPKNTIEFHFYSAEEGGMLGSLDLFTAYVEKQKKVTAMLQQDMTGYVQDPNDEHVGIITDHTTPQLTDFIKLIIDSYLRIPFKESECGYACSDHSSATKNGYPAAFVIESQMSSNNRYVHTTMDTIDRLSLDHMAEHAKIGLGYILELGNWNFEIKK
ncbi:hypothetical protein ZYGR_0N05230 [Zygosaccharomyces rouxii]|uniref:Peptide hydrolase n=2 Tax=Zygosaccharomyces rouxii TaxID=4956 RepID=C5DW66_ZYGRC|nr:uncharacterized protein ZYRO0D12320g [Zygosaccharomyces rouxii]KAH9200944.1 hypothetical protein LQ764DRAFT_177176 [Zygosaccharomyces rouxii]GAV49118.1 hypothetical protein ZYGR_0N05230 [Zygosaccharomyces rouxii]CAR28035.1 ZYRO0D12320p [Zygosaccharomyces rouxii]